MSRLRVVAANSFVASAVGIALLVTRSLRPLRTFFANMWRDWTLATFGMAGFLPLLVAIGFDEVDRLYSLYFMVLLALVMVSMAWWYMQARQHRQRVLALLIGILSTTTVTVIAPTLYWQQHGWVHHCGGLEKTPFASESVWGN